MKHMIMDEDGNFSNNVWSFVSLVYGIHTDFSLLSNSGVIHERIAENENTFFSKFAVDVILRPLLPEHFYIPAEVVADTQ